MISCPTCRELTVSVARCDHCGTSIGSRSARSVGAVALGLVALTGCPLIGVGNKYGIPDTGFTDEDGDGYPLNVDCDDLDPDIHPDAEETAGDGVDSNCDGEDDT